MNIYRNAFTMLEIIFVLVLIGILMSIGSAYIHTNYLLNDTNYIISQIRNKQKNAIGKDIYNFGNALWKMPDEGSSNFDNSCVKFTKEWFEKQDKNSPNPYILHSSTSINSSVDKLCFDNMGRAYQDGQLLHKVIDINISDIKKSNIISIFPISGAAYVYWNKK